jgi:hypothetical protein
MYVMQHFMIYNWRLKYITNMFTECIGYHFVMLQRFVAYSDIQDVYLKQLFG